MLRITSSSRLPGCFLFCSLLAPQDIFLHKTEEKTNQTQRHITNEDLPLLFPLSNQNNLSGLMSSHPISSCSLAYQINISFLQPIRTTAAKIIILTHQSHSSLNLSGIFYEAWSSNSLEPCPQGTPASLYPIWGLIPTAASPPSSQIPCLAWTPPIYFPQLLLPFPRLPLFFQPSWDGRMILHHLFSLERPVKLTAPHAINVMQADKKVYREEMVQKH